MHVDRCEANCFNRRATAARVTGSPPPAASRPGARWPTPSATGCT